jgi:hypothetical protein
VPELIAHTDRRSLVIEIGGMPVRVNTSDADFLEMVHTRYAGFFGFSDKPEIDFDIDLSAPRTGVDAPVSVVQRSGRWLLQRGDFRAEWEPAQRRGKIQQFPNPYAIDAVLRIVHTLVLAEQGGFLVHAASAIRNGKAFLFAGVSGAGKTTMSRLAPSDVALLTDEISYVRKQDNRYIAYGTPFTGELARMGENISAPIAGLYLLAKGSENRIEPLASAPAVRELLANILFFAQDMELARMVFDSACQFVDRVPVSRLTFVPDSRVWEMIG